MASSLPSFEVFGSPTKPGISVTHLCMSVKRTVSGSVSGYLSVSAMAMSSVLSQSKVGGMLLLGKQFTSHFKLVISFLGVILVPLGNLYHDVRGAVRNRLAGQARFRGYSRR